MEHMLTNRCVMDERTLRKTYARLYRRQLLVFYIGTGLILAFSALMVVLQGGLSPMPAFLILAAVAYLCIGLRMPKKQAMQQIRRYEADGFDKSPEVTVWFGEDELTGRREGAEDLTHISYGSMKSILLNGDRIILWTEQKQYVVLDTARFENGTEDDFWKLMCDKCILAVPKSRLRA